MTKFFKIAIVSLAVLGSASSAQALDTGSFTDRVFTDIELNGN